MGTKISCLCKQATIARNRPRQNGPRLHARAHSRFRKLRYFFSILKKRSKIADRPVKELCPKQTATRLIGVQVSVLLLGLAVATRLCVLQVVQFEKWDEMAQKQHITAKNIQGARGVVVDRLGRTLAASVETFSVGAHLRKIPDKAMLARSVSPLIGLSVNDIEQRLRSQSAFVWLARGLERDKQEAITALGNRGLSTTPEFRRIYPQGTLGGSILGRIGRDGKGQSGIELAFDEQLAAGNIHLSMRRDALGRLMPIQLTDPSDSPSERFMQFFPGASLVPAAWKRDAAQAAEAQTSNSFREEGGAIALSIDSLVQHILEEELEVGRAAAKAKRAFGLVMDAETGELLAVSNVPKLFDPNKLTDVSPQDLRNPALQDAFEPGSTFKPLVAAAAVDQGRVRMDESMNCENGSYTVGRNRIRDVHPVGVVSLTEVLVRSSNICMAKVGQRMGRVRLRDSLKRFGFGSASGVELPGEASGILRPISDWRDIDVVTASFGQGIAVTALQMARAYAVLANGGILVAPSILHKEERSEGAQRILKESAVRSVLKGLQGVTEDEHGTGKLARIDGVTVYGKTGTAEKPREDGRGYDPSKVISSFVGFVDGTGVGVTRKLVMFVAVDEPQTDIRYGGVLAAPVFSRSVSRILSYLVTVEGSLVRRNSPRTNETYDDRERSSVIDVS